MSPAGAGSKVEYTAEFRLKGMLKVAEPFVRPAFRSLAGPAMDGMKKALDSLAAS